VRWMPAAVPGDLMDTNDAHYGELQLLIGGEWVGSAGRETVPDPGRGKPITEARDEVGIE